LRDLASRLAIVEHKLGIGANPPAVNPKPSASAAQMPEPASK
jgi:hypothetical protein